MSSNTNLMIVHANTQITQSRLTKIYGRGGLGGTIYAVLASARSVFKQRKILIFVGCNCNYMKLQENFSGR